MQSPFQFNKYDKKLAAEAAEAMKKETNEEAPKKPVNELKDNKKGAESFSSSSDEDGTDALSKNDIQKFKKLIADQDMEIENLKIKVKQYSKNLK